MPSPSDPLAHCAAAGRLVADAIRPRTTAKRPESDRGSVAAFVTSLCVAGFCERHGLLRTRVGSFEEVADTFDRLAAAFRIDPRSGFFRVPAAARGRADEMGPPCLAVVRAAEDLAIDGIGILFQRFQDDAFTRQEGIVYTPRPLVEVIVRDALGAYGPTRRGELLRVLDPACGSGVFLLEILRQLLKRSRRPRDPDYIERMLAECVFGVDKDPLAVEMAKVTLLLFVLVQRGDSLLFDLPDLTPSVRCGNSLLSPDETSHVDRKALKELAPFSWRDAFPAVFEKGGFSCIVGNPPYGLSRGEKLGALENALLQDVYEEWRHGKVNKYLAFMARGYDLLAPGGVCSMIVPNAWLGIKAGLRIRERFLADGALRRVRVFDHQVFDDLKLEPVVFTAKKGDPADTIEIDRTSRDGTIENACTVPVASCLRAPDGIIPTRWTKGLDAVFDHVAGASVPLASPGSPFRPYIALQAYSLGRGTPPQTAEMVKKHVYHSDKPAGRNPVPYLEGSDVKRFTPAWSGRYLDYGPWLAEYHETDRYEVPRVLVREITDRPPRLLVAAVTDEPFTYNKSVLHILPVSEGAAGIEEMRALCVILNSTFASCVIGYRGRKTQRRLFPKVVNDDLKDFPLPADFSRHVTGLASHARPLAADAPAAGELDEAVFDSYGLSRRQRKTVTDAVAALPR